MIIFFVNFQKNHKGGANSKVLPNKLPEQLDIISIPIQIGNILTNAIIDTGASYDYISKDFTTRMNLSLRPTEIKTISLGDGTKIESSYRSNMRFNLLKSTNSDITVSPYVIEGLPYDLVLGMPFLEYHKVKIDFKDHTITINDISLDISKSLIGEKVLKENKRITENKNYLDYENLSIFSKIHQGEFVIERLIIPLS